MLAALAGTGLFLAAQTSHAQDWVTFFEQGKKLSEAGKWAEACPKFAEAHRLKPDATGITLNLADCYKHIGKNASAYSLFREGGFLAKKASDTARADYAEKEAAALEPTLSHVQIDAADTPGLIIRIDETELGKGALGTSVPVDPGTHKVEATAPGYNVWSTTVTVVAGKDAPPLKIPTLSPLPPDTKGGPPPVNPALRPAAFAVGGVGVAGLVVGGVFGGLAMSAKSDLSKLCTNNGCTASNGGQDKLASAKSKALISTIGVSVGGAALATGVVLFVLSTRGGATPKDEKSAPPKTALVPTFDRDGGGLSLTGAF